jgi:hypothetical protein
MLTIEVDRFAFANDSTGAFVRLSSDPFTCFIVEDERRRKKVPGETCIPPGQYEVKLRTDSAKFQKYYDRFPDFHRGMLWLQDVPGFTYVYIHIGNTDDHTEGCLLPGLAPVMLPDGEFTVGRSKDAYVALYKRVCAAFDKNERVFVNITERSRESLES